MTATQRLYLMRTGYRAARAGRSSTACPYSLINDRAEAQQAAVWIRGWVYGRNDTP